MARDKSIIIEKMNTETEEWNEFYSGHAEINKASGKEYVNIGSVISKNVFNFDLIYNKKLEDIIFNTEIYRIKYKNRIFNIVNADDFKLRHIKIILVGETING